MSENVSNTYLAYIAGEAKKLFQLPDEEAGKTYAIEQAMLRVRREAFEEAAKVAEEVTIPAPAEARTQMDGWYAARKAVAAELRRLGKEQ